MSLYTIITDKLVPLLYDTLSVTPNSKKNALQCDDLKNHSGFIQWHAAKYCNNVELQTYKRKTSMMVCNDGLHDTFNVEDLEFKDELLKDVHRKGQVIMGDMVKVVTEYIECNTGQRQCDISRDLGLNKDYGDNNWTIYTILNMMVNRGIAKKQYESKKPIYSIIEAKLYEPTEYIVKKNYASCLEAECANYLMKHDMKFVQQHTYPDCVYKKLLRFDFRANSPDGNEFLIEVNGKQHYEYTSHFHKTHKDFELQQKKDAIKIKYAYDNDIPLLIIKYDENIGDKIENFLYEEKL